MSVEPAARFNLIDHHGKNVSEVDYAGHWLLVYFGFTHCKVVCPRSMAKLSQVLDSLGGDADRLTPLYVTVDPARDTPAVMRAYIEANCPRFTGLTGSTEQIDAAKRAFRVFAQRRDDPDDPDGYDVPHSAVAYLMGPDGGYRDHFAESVAQDVVRGRIVGALAANEVSR